MEYSAYTSGKELLYLNDQYLHIGNEGAWIALKNLYLFEFKGKGDSLYLLSGQFSSIESLKTRFIRLNLFFCLSCFKSPV